VVNSCINSIDIYHTDGYESHSSEMSMLDIQIGRNFSSSYIRFTYSLKLFFQEKGHSETSYMYKKINLVHLKILQTSACEETKTDN
jgi:hypothetical protein